MTELEKENQELRREIVSLKAEIEALKHLRQLDMSEIAYQRRQIDFLLEVREENKRSAKNAGFAPEQAFGLSGYT